MSFYRPPGTIYDRKPYTPLEAAGLVAHASDSPHSRADPNRVLTTAVRLEEAAKELDLAREWQAALEVIAEYACSHGDECPDRDPKCPSCIAHAVLALEVDEDEE